MALYFTSQTMYKQYVIRKNSERSYARPSFAELLIINMPYCPEIHFDNDRRLSKKYYYFEYKDIKFKLIQNSPRKYADSLITIIENYSLKEIEKIFSIASEYLSALSWNNNSRVMLWGPSGSRRDRSLNCVRTT